MIGCSLGRLGASAHLSPIARALALLRSSKAVYWRDPSDLSTLFQDSAGTTPVTAVEQPVGLMLDKRTAGQLGSELVTNGDFSGGATGWTALAGWSVGSGVATATATSSSLYFTGSPVAGRVYRVEFDYTHTSGTLAIAVGGNYAGQVTTTTSGRKSFHVVSGSGTRLVEFYGGTVTSVIDNISVREIPGVHFIQATPASRPILKQDSNGCYYLNYDGVDDSQASAATVDLTGTDKITVVGAWHKASDAAQGILVETSAAVSSNNGAFLIAAPTAAGLAGYDLTSKGTTAVQAYSGSSFPAPHTAVLSAIGDISGDRATLRVNGVQRVQATGDQGTGNYGNHTVFVGSRSGSSLRFNGREYGFALFNTTLSASELAAVEAYFRSKSRAY